MFFIWIFLASVFLNDPLATEIDTISLYDKHPICAKREGTGRKEWIVVMFIISMAIIALVVIGWILFYILGILFMRSM